MRHSRVFLGLLLLSLTACRRDPEVTSSSPATGPYGTIVTLEGWFPHMDHGLIEFEDGMTVPNARMLEVSGSRLRFRVPSPTRGAFRAVGDGESLFAGTFEPEPWRPLALAKLNGDVARLDFTVFGQDSMAELRREGETLVALFEDRDGVVRVPVRGAGRPSGGVAWSESAGELRAFVLEQGSDPVLRALTIERSGAHQIATTLPEDATELLGFDRQDGRRFAFVADVDEKEVLKYEWNDAGLEPIWVAADPAPTTAGWRRFAARSGHAWRIWVVSIETIFDVTFEVYAAYLAPGSSQFQSPFRVGGGDDSASRLDVLGMTDRGEVVVEFCGVDSDVVDSTVIRCQSAAFGPDGVIASSNEVQGKSRTLHLALPDGLRELVCEDDAHELYASHEPRGPDFGDPLVSPCVDRVPAYRLGLDGKPGFIVDGAAAPTLLTRP